MTHTRPDSDWYRDLSLMAGDVFYVMRTAPDQGLEFMTDSVLDVLGYSAQQMCDGGLDFMLSIADPRDADDLLHAVSIAPGESHYLEMRWQHATGRVVVAQHWMRKVVRPDGSEAIEGNTREVTALRLLESELRESEDRFRNAMEHAAIGMCLVSPAGQFLGVNQALCELLDRDEVTLRDTTWQTLTHPGDLHTDVSLVDDVLSGRRDSYRLLKRFLRPDQTVVWGDISVSCVRDEGGRARYLVTQIVDVSAQMEVEQALRDSEAQYRRSEAAAQADRARLQAVMDAMVDPHFLIGPIRDGAGEIVDFRLKEANDAALAHTGITREQILDVTLQRMPGHGEPFIDKFARAIETGEALVEDAAIFISPRHPDVVRRFDIRAVRVGDDLSLTMRDVTQREEAAKLIADSQERYRLLAENATDMIFRLDLHGIVEWVSQGVTRILGGSAESYLGRDIINLVAPVDRESGLAAFREARDGLRSTMRLRLLDSAGHPRWIEANLRVVTGADGVVHFVGGCRDIQTEMEALAELDRRARTDQLTGLFNRDEALTRLRILLSSERGGPVAVAFCDVDAFKQVNDSLGHAAGDALLVETARRIRGIVRDGDVIARVGGDEILVVLPGVHTLEHALLIGEKLRNCLHDPVETETGTVRSTLSVGITVALPGEDAEDVTSRADAAMYKAKQAGRDRVMGA